MRVSEPSGEGETARAVLIRNDTIDFINLCSPLSLHRVISFLSSNRPPTHNVFHGANDKLRERDPLGAQNESRKNSSSYLHGPKSIRR